MSVHEDTGYQSAEIARLRGYIKIHEEQIRNFGILITTCENVQKQWETLRSQIASTTQIGQPSPIMDLAKNSRESWAETCQLLRNEISNKAQSIVKHQAHLLELGETP